MRYANTKQPAQNPKKASKNAKNERIESVIVNAKLFPKYKRIMAVRLNKNPII